MYVLSLKNLLPHLNFKSYSIKKFYPFDDNEVFSAFDIKRNLAYFCSNRGISIFNPASDSIVYSVCWKEVPLNEEPFLDNDGNIWINTQEKIYRFHPVSNSLQVIEPSDPAIAK